MLFIPDDVLSMPFNPSTFINSDSQRKDLAISITDNVRKEFARLDAVLMMYIKEHSERLFKKPLTLEQVKTNYCSCIRTTVGWPAIIKTKVDLGGGKYGVTCWSEDGEAVDMPESWKDYTIKPRIVISNLWVLVISLGLFSN